MIKINELQKEIIGYRKKGKTWLIISFLVHKNIYFCKKVFSMTHAQKEKFTKKQQNKQKLYLKGYLTEEKKLEIRERAREYYRKNREKLKNKRRENFEMRFSNNLRARLRMSLKSQNTQKNNKTMVYVGCTKKFLKIYLSSLFTDGMEWSNYGEWHIDHIKPLVKFNLKEEAEIYEAMNYTNLQPLWASDNLKKNSTYPQFSLKSVSQAIDTRKEKE